MSKKPKNTKMKKLKPINTSTLTWPTPPKEEEWQGIMTFLSQIVLLSPKSPEGKVAKRALAALATWKNVQKEIEITLKDRDRAAIK